MSHHLPLADRGLGLLNLLLHMVTDMLIGSLLPILNSLPPFWRLLELLVDAIPALLSVWYAGLGGGPVLEHMVTFRAA